MHHTPKPCNFLLYVAVVCKYLRNGGGPNILVDVWGHLTLTGQLSNNYYWNHLKFSLVVFSIPGGVFCFNPVLSYMGCNSCSLFNIIFPDVFMTRLLTQTDVQLFAMYHWYHYNSQQKKKKSLYYTGLCVCVCACTHLQLNTGFHPGKAPLIWKHAPSLVPSSLWPLNPGLTRTRWF